MSDTRKRVVLSDSSLNRYGYRVLTSGLDIEAFKKNPVMLWAHFRDEGSPIWGNYLPIGHWEDIQINDDELSAIPVFDLVDETSKIIAAKYEAGTLSASSIGIKILATSSEKEFLLPGQTRETVTKSELMEASIVDIPANSNAVRLYDRSTSAILAAGVDTQVVPAIKIEEKMKFKPTWGSILSFLNIGKEKVDSTEFTADHIEQLNVELGRLTASNETLSGEKTSLENKVKEINTTLTEKDNEISQLKQQIENLKKNPDAKSADIAPKTELGGEDDFQSFCDKNAGDHIAISNEMKRLGMI